MAYDPATGNMVLYGGFGNLTASNIYAVALRDTWTWDGTTWTKLSPATSPSASSNVSMAYDPATGSMILFGGTYTLTARFNETWTWDGTTWTKLSPTTSPPAAVGASMAYDPATGNMVLFGGGGIGPDNFLVGTWTFGPPQPSSTWTQLAPATSPTARTRGSMAYDPATGNVVLFGGFNSSGLFGDTWTWNGTTWTKLSPAKSPPASTSTAMAYDPVTGTVLLFLMDSGLPTGYTWSWNGITWTKLSPATLPPDYYGASMAYDPATGNMVLFGGIGATPNAIGDTWTWDGTTWTKHSPATSPPGRYFASMAYDATTGNMVLFGGIGATTTLGDTWTWNGTTWTKHSPATSPPARHGASMAYDPTTDDMVLFGGATGGISGDTWTWNGTTWTKLSPTASPPARAFASSAYDPLTANMVLFGGTTGIGHSIGDTWTFGPPTSVVPAKPATPTATAGTTTATVAWTAPATGGSGISKYTVTSTPAGKTCTTTGTLACQVTGLTNGTAYTFTVIASNHAGTSVPSGPSNRVVPTSVAPQGTSSSSGNDPTASTPTTAPVKVVATAIGAGTLTVAAYPSDPVVGFSAGTGYFDVKISPTSLFSTVSFKVCGLVSGQGVSWWNPTVQTWQQSSDVTAVNGLGCVTVTVNNSTTPNLAQLVGTIFATTLAPPPTKPGTPTATAGNTTAMVTWTAATPQGNPIVSYTATSTPTGKACTTASALTCSISGLKNGTAYTFTVRARNLRGTGPASTRSGSVTPSGVPSPTVTSLSRTSGPDSGGSKVTITGTGFSTVRKVTFGTTTAVFTVSSATSIIATSPAHAVGTVRISITTAGGTTPTSRGDSFKYTYPVPTVSAVSPASGPATGGTSVTVSGSGFSGASTVYFGSSTGTALSVNAGGTQLNVKSPAGTSGAAVNVRVVTPGGTSAIVSSDLFTYGPVITSLSRTTGPVGGGTKVTITGNGFTTVKHVKFGTTTGTSYTVKSATQIVATSPAHAAGTAAISVTTTAGTTPTSSTDLYRYR